MPTVLIASATSLGQMRQRSEFQDAMAFADTDALRALEAITRQRANLVVIESAFAATSRGTALINRIKADPSLSDCEVRVMAHTPEPEAPVEDVAADVVPGVAVPDVIMPGPTAPPSVPDPTAGAGRAGRAGHRFLPARPQRHTAGAAS